MGSDGHITQFSYIVDVYNFEKINSDASDYVSDYIKQINNEAALAMQAGILKPFKWHLYSQIFW